MDLSVDLPDAAVKITAQDWVAIVLATPQADEHGFYHVHAHTIGADGIKAEDGAVYVLNAWAFGRTAFIRVKPEHRSELDFDTKIMHHRGFVRFSYKLESGSWHYPDASMKIPFVGAATCQMT